MLKMRQHKAHVMEIQVNGGSVSDKVDFSWGSLEQEFMVGDIFEKDEVIDTVGVTRGKGMVGPIKRFGCSRLNRKTHRGLRKVACIGAWHPSAVKWTVGRRGQQGYHSRTEIHKKIYRVGTGAVHGCTNNAMCDADATDGGDVLVDGISVAHGVVGASVDGTGSNAVDLLMDLGTGMVTLLSTTSNSPLDCGWMPRQ